MSEQTLAVKYRPHTFDDVVEQGSIKIILQQQLKEGSIKNAYLFTGGAGTGSRGGRAASARRAVPLSGPRAAVRLLPRLFRARAVSFRAAFLAGAGLSVRAMR